MVIVRLTGGVGNQMFQYAAAGAVADRLDAELLLDTRAFVRLRWMPTPAARTLAPFRLRARLATAADLKDWPVWVVDIGMRLRLFSPLVSPLAFRVSDHLRPGHAHVA